MNALEELKELEAEIRSRLLNGESFNEIGQDSADQYIDLVEQIEGKSQYNFSEDMIRKYKYLHEFTQIKNDNFWGLWDR